MYPKNPTSPTSEEKKFAKREQLASLIINKFRNKFRINLALQRELDEKISEAVYEMVCSDGVVSDK
jgi:hypothetical protein